MSNKKKICFLLSNDGSRDPRVAKEIGSATKSGFENLLLAYYWKSESKNFPLIEEKKGYKIIRGVFDPKNDFFDRLTVIFSKFQSYLNLLFTYISKKNKSTSNQPSERVKRKSANPQKEKSKTWLIQVLASLYNAIYQHVTIFNYYRGMSHFHYIEGLKKKPDIIHANDLDTLYAGYIIKKKTGAKLLYDAHEIWTKQGLMIPKLLIWFFSILEWFLLRRTDAIISVNESLIKEMERMYSLKFKSPTLAVLNCPTYQKIGQIKPIDSKIKILYQGGCFPNRGIEQLSLSAKYLPANTLIIIRALGDPRIIEKVEEIRKRYHLESKIEVTSPVPPKELVKTAKEADIGVIANQPNNINNYLVLPNKIFEYMSAGLAIAASDFPEMRKIIKKYHNGILFNPTSPKSIAKNLKKIMADKKQLMVMKRNSLLAAKEFNWQKEEKKLIGLYEKLLQN